MEKHSAGQGKVPVSWKAVAGCRAALVPVLASLLLALLLAAHVTLPAPARSASAPPYSSSLEIVRLQQDLGPATAGALLGVYWITPVPGWYVYSHEPGPTGIPTTLQAMLAPAQEYLQVFYPPGVVKEDSLEPGVMVEVYASPTPIFIVFPAESDPWETLHLRLRMLLCSERSCWPVDTGEEFFVDQIQAQMVEPEPMQTRAMDWVDSLLTSSPGATRTPFVRPGAPPAQTGVEADKTTLDMPGKLEPIPFQPGLEVRGLAKALLLALLGGLILNLTPCVLPVVSLKLRGLIPDETAGDLQAQRKAFRDHNQLFALGILTFFMFLAFLLSFTGMLWGQLFQSPNTVIILATLLLSLSLSLFGVFNLPVIDLKLGRKGQTSMSAEGQSYFTGILATLLATPCSGPFLGGVLAWTLLQPPLVVAGVFFCVGLGMSSPYFVISFFPALVRFVPKPGNWTLYLEKALGFLLLATCIYLLTFLPEEFLFPTLALFWVTGMAAWIWGGWTSLSQTAGRRWSIRLPALVLVLVVGGWALTAKPLVSHWESFISERYTQALGRDRMLVKFTAEWCPNCKFLEKIVLTPDNLAPLQDRFEMRLIKVDLTNENPAAMDLLRALGSQSIPLVAVFPSGEEAMRPLILRDLFTLGQLEQALSQAFRPGG